MALTVAERAEIRKRFHRLPETEMNYTKAQLNAGVDAMDQWILDNKPSAAAAIEAAAPGEFDAIEKKRIAALVLRLHYEKDFV